MLLGLAWGAGCFLFGVSWVYVSLSQFGGMAPPAAAAATLAFCLYLALFPALAGGLFLRWRRGTAGDVLLFAGLWTLGGVAARHAIHRLSLARGRLFAKPAQPAGGLGFGARRVWRRLRRRADRRAAFLRLAQAAGLGHDPAAARVAAGC
jgi:hypothetical protein